MKKRYIIKMRKKKLNYFTWIKIKIQFLSLFKKNEI